VKCAEKWMEAEGKKKKKKKKGQNVESERKNMFRGEIRAQMRCFDDAACV
jgi:hypothetical protein